jgi:hypothetical protein
MFGAPLISFRVQLEYGLESREAAKLPPEMRAQQVPSVGNTLITHADMCEWTVLRVAWRDDPDLRMAFPTVHVGPRLPEN